MSMPFPLFSAPMKFRMFSCFIPLKLYISYSFCQDSLFCITEHTTFFVLMTERLLTHKYTHTPHVLPEWGRFLQPHVRSAAVPSTRSQSAPWPLSPATAVASGPGVERAESTRGPAERPTTNQHPSLLFTAHHAGLIIHTHTHTYTGFFLFKLIKHAACQRNHNLHRKPSCYKAVNVK